MTDLPLSSRSFHLHSCLGRGGFGEVYHATMHQPGGLSTDVALKLLRSDASLDAGALARLQDEGRLLSRLKHPSILKVHDLTRIDGRVGLITEYVPGEDFHHALRDEARPLPPRASLEVASHIASALDAAYHSRSIAGQPLQLVHRDIKPSNIRIGLHGDVKLLDFGVAHSLAPDRQAMTKTDTALGSLPYMSPDRFQRGEPSPATDIYALGCCLYEGLCGERVHVDPVPVEMFALAAVAKNHDQHIEDRLAHIPDAVDETVRSLLQRMLRHDPAARPTAQEVSSICETLAIEAGGLSLRAWMRDHTCLPPQTLPAALQGRRFTEGEVGQTFPVAGAAAATDAVTLPHEQESRPPSLRARLGVASLGGVLVAVLAGLALSLSNPPEPIPEPPKTAAETTPVPSKQQVTYVELRGDVLAVELHGVDGAIHTLPAWLPPGPYDVYANFGAVKRWVRKVNVSGKRANVQCDLASYACAIAP